MNIIWHYLDKRGAAVNALKDYGSMQYIIDHTDEEIASVHDRITSVGEPVLSDMPPGPHNPQATENRIIIFHYQYNTFDRKNQSFVY